MSASLENNIRKYKRKLYASLSLKGFLISLSILLFVFLFYVLLENQVYLNSLARAVLFYSYLTLAIAVLYKLFFENLFRLLGVRHQLSDEEAARKIGGYFPEIKDKLLNIVQLKNLSPGTNLLLTAGITQKSGEIGHIAFSDAIRYRENLKYLKILLVPFLIVALIGVLSPGLLTEPAKRIVQYKKEFAPQAPFQFFLDNEDLTAFKNEDFEVRAGISGESLPSDLFLLFGERKIKLRKTEEQSYVYTFEKVQQDISFRLSAAGFNSPVYRVRVVNRPNIRNFEVELNYPDYIDKNIDRLSNVGNFQAPEGTEVKWYFQTLETNELNIVFLSPTEKEKNMLVSDNELFTFEKQIKNSTDYTLDLVNEYSHNKDVIRYHIEIIKDKYPEIDLQQHRDTVMYQQILLGGQISDDYGLTGLRLHYRTAQETPFASLPIRIDRTKNQQSFYYQWMLDTLSLKNGQQVEYYLSVSDNDGINGAKTSTTSRYLFRVPNKEEVNNLINKSSQSTENQIDKTLEKSKKLRQELQNADDKLKSKKQLDWKDENQLKEIIEQKQQLEQDLEKLREQFRELNEMKERFREGEENKRLSEKIEQLQKLMDELLDEETKKMYEELQKLLEENKNLNELKNLVEQLNQKEFNLEKELERSLEMFKQLKYEQQLEDAVEQSEELAREQEKLAEEGSERKADSEELLEKQRDIQEELKNLEENIDKMNEMNQELKHPNPPADFKEDFEQINESINESIENLEQKKNKKANDAQQNAQQQMQKMAEKLQQMQSSGEMMSMESNLGDLREILENLIKLSFEQERIMDEFRQVNQSDPKFLELSQKQLNIKDDAKIIEDSLLSLANRVFQIQSFVTREVGDMNKSIDDALDAIKERRKEIAVGKQQYAMTSMNNLALMLDNVMDQMQQAMADMMGNAKSKGQQGKAPSMSELQQQLGEQIKQLKESGKQGRQLSEELSRMAAEQERIRRMLEEMQKQMNPLENGDGPGNNLEDIMRKMEETEIDLVNKRITEQLIKRQQEIVTRLLEAENADKEREQSEEREAEHAKKHQKQIPREFEEYIKVREQEIELLKTVPPKLNHYYKSEVNKYFNRLGNF